LICPKCGEGNVELLQDAYEVFEFKGFDPAGGYIEGERIRTDLFDDLRIVCTNRECGAELAQTDFPDNRNGD
jgi:hypothetical protein